MHSDMLPKPGLFAAALILLSLSATSPVAAQGITSAYSKLDFDNGCQWAESQSEEEAQMGGSAVCAGFGEYDVHFAEWDIRQFLAYGPVDDPEAFASGFGQWNSVHDVIEWRLEGDRPFATIHRWFLDNIDPDTGAAVPESRGQVLAIATVADPALPEGQRKSCVVGYVDALANSDANVMARKVADEIARDFRCGFDKPAYHGIRGPLSGSPYAIADQD